MKKRYLFILWLGALCLACTEKLNDAIAVVKEEGTATVIISGDITDTLEYSCEFEYVIDVTSSSSSLDITMNNFTDPVTLLGVSLKDYNSASGFVEGVDYYGTDDPNITAVFVTPDGHFNTDVSDSLTTRIVLEQITDTRITGNFEFRLVKFNPPVQRINIVGNFTGIGKTQRK